MLETFSEGERKQGPRGVRSITKIPFNRISHIGDIMENDSNFQSASPECVNAIDHSANTSTDSPR